MQFWLKKIMFVLHQLNQIRDSLAVMGDNSTAFSLPQVRTFDFSCSAMQLEALMAVNCWISNMPLQYTLCYEHKIYIVLLKLENMIFLCVEETYACLCSFIKIHI